MRQPPPNIHSPLPLLPLPSPLPTLTPVQHSLEPPVIFIHAPLELPIAALPPLQVKEARHPDNLVIQALLPSLDLLIELQVAPVCSLLGPVIPLICGDDMQVKWLDIRPLKRLKAIDLGIVAGHNGGRVVTNAVQPGIRVTVCCARPICRYEAPLA